MNRAWITGLTLAVVAGSAGAAFATASSTTHDSAAQAQGLEAAAVAPDTEAPAAAFNYQVGTAGAVSITSSGGVLTITGALPAPGWTLVTYSSPAAHVEAQFTDSLQIVTFGADLVGTDVVVALSDLPAPGVEMTAATVPMDITVVSSGSPSSTNKTNPTTHTTVKQTTTSTRPASSYTPTTTPRHHHDDDHNTFPEPHDD